MKTRGDLVSMKKRGPWPGLALISQKGELWPGLPPPPPPLDLRRDATNKQAKESR